MVRDFPKSEKPTEWDYAYHFKFGFLLLFSVDKRLEQRNRAIGKEISDVPFRTEKEEYLWRQSTISEPIFRKITVPLTFNRNFQIF